MTPNFPKKKKSKQDELTDKLFKELATRMYSTKRYPLEGHKSSKKPRNITSRKPVKHHD